MEHLFSPWRLAYITANSGSSESAGCIFCNAAQPQSHDLVLIRGRLCYVILNLYPYNNGHLMVVPYRHAPSLATLTSEELQELALLLQRSELALTDAYEPHGFNVGVNLGKSAGAGVQDHVHVHVVPRWNGDTNFMTVVGDMRVLPESLGQSAGRLRPIFKRLAQP
jgi:ATP adenylyltransferase